MRTSRVPTSSTARWICEKLVTSSVRGVTRPSECAKGWRVPAYTRFAPLLKASTTSALPMPRLAPVIKIVLFPIFMAFSFETRGFISWRRLFACDSYPARFGDLGGQRPQASTADRHRPAFRSHSDRDDG